MLLFINVISALTAPTAASRGRPLWPLAPGIIALCAGRPVLAARCNRRICAAGSASKTNGGQLCTLKRAVLQSNMACFRVQKRPFCP